MLTLPHYQIIQSVCESTKSRIYRASRLSDNQVVILKILKENYYHSTEVASYQQEHAIICHLTQVDGIIRTYGLEKFQRLPFLVLEDLGGQSLSHLYSKQALSLSDFFTLAISITKILGALHKAEVIHKDINPSNILLNPLTGQVKLIDFGLSTRLPRENPTLKSLHQLEGTLPYLSPEQTGRMNRSLDYRTDFYALGITFYELLTGQLPFTSQDAAELVHCHLAKHPLPPHQLNSLVPPILSEIILKLMAKAAEDRYQSAWGLQQDLEACQRQFIEKNHIDPFQLAQYDFSDRFQLPQKLYGREAALVPLLSALEQVTHGQSQLLLVAGYSGIGKSSLVQEIYKPITEKRGYFIVGKFDQFQRNIPYSAIAQAFRELVQQLLIETSLVLEKWKSQILTAVGNSGQIIIDVIPEIEWILGPQPPVPLLGAMEAQHRFNLVFQNFIRVFCQTDHPLVLFLDDLQWIDSASLKLIPLMITNTSHLLLVGAYRDNEVSPTHPLMLTLAEMQKTMGNFHTLTLTSLALPHVRQLVEDTLKTSEEIASPLAKLLVEKTAGNPFFMSAFLKTLYVEKLIQFDFEYNAWRWDMMQIEAQNITDNVVELMSEKVQKLAEHTQQLLKLAACIGNQFDLGILAYVADQSETEARTHLWQAVVEGFIFPIGELYKFAHDRIQQATYSLIPKSDKPALHRRIGQLLLAKTERLEERLFEIVDHLNVGLKLFDEQSEREMLIRLNVQAGQKAKMATAYQAAFEYLNTAMSLLEVNSWEMDYNLSLLVYQEATEIAYLYGDFAAMQKWSEVVLQHARNTLDKIKVYEAKIATYTSQSQPLQAIQTALEILAELDIIFPQSPSHEDIQEVIEKVLRLVPPTGIESIIDLPTMTDPRTLAALRILSTMNPPCYMAAPQLFVIEVFTQVQLSLQYHADISPYAYACGAMLFNAIVHDIETGHQFGELALKLTTKLHAQQIKSKTWFVFANFVSHGKRHLKESLPFFSEAYQSGLESGDIEHVGFSLSQKSHYGYFTGHELPRLDKEAFDHYQMLIKIKQGLPTGWLQTVRLALSHLLAPSGLSSYSFNVHDELQLLHALTQSNDYTGLFHFHLHRMVVNYLLGHLEQAWVDTTNSQYFMHAAPGFFSIPILYFYDSLICLARYPAVPVSQQNELLNRISENQKKLHHLAHHAPTNFQHKYKLVEAEKAKVLGQEWKAARLYEKAIIEAREAEYLQEEALAYELAAEFYLADGINEIMQTYLMKAYLRYQRWGAKAKVKQLEQKYPSVFVQGSSLAGGTLTLNIPTESSSASSTQSSMLLDVHSLSKFSQILLGERNLTQLLNKMMSLVIENAGAQVGFLLLPEGQDQCIIQAHAHQEGIEVLQALPLTPTSPLATSVVQYVCHTHQSVMLDHAVRQGRFTRDPHIIRQHTQSLLCIPLLNQGQLSGIIYLENNLIQGAFTPARVEMLSLLSSQLAISIENALLYERLEHKVAQRTTELATANREIIDLNKKLKSENLRMSTELEVSRHLQQMVLPKPSELEHIQDLDIAALMEPASEVGGDYYDVLQHRGFVKIGIGDVAGHGLESGLLMLMVQTAVRTLLTTEIHDPIQFLELLNNVLYNNIQRMNFDKNLTLCLMDYREGKVRMSGQHEEVLFVRKNGYIERIDTISLGFFLGVKSHINDLLGYREIILNRGDGIVLYTDGITEALNQDGQAYGIEQLCAVVHQTWHGSATQVQQEIFRDVHRHIGEQHIADDMTVLVFKRR